MPNIIPMVHSIALLRLSFTPIKTQRSAWHLRESAQKWDHLPFSRHVHQTTERFYTESGLQKFSFRFYFGLSRRKTFPDLMDRYYQTIAVIAQKDKIPLLHAQSIGLRSWRLFFEAYQPRAACLRSKNQELLATPEAVKERIKQIQPENFSTDAWGHFKLDHIPFFRTHLLSVSYSLSDTQPAESAFDLLFHNQRAIKIEAAYAEDVKRLFPNKPDRFEPLIKSLQSLSRAYEALPIASTLYCLAIPKSLIGRVAYDSRQFGLPTGREIAQIASNLSLSPRAHQSIDGGMQARFILSQETLHPDADIDLIDINNPQEVNRYIAGYKITSPRKVEVFKKIFDQAPSQSEQAYQQTLEALDRKVRDLYRFHPNGTQRGLIQSY